MRAETAVGALDVVVSTLPVNSYPATVLFDSGASHAFISTDFVKKNWMLMRPMGNTMLVNSPRGELRATLRCPNVHVTIRGVDFLTHPIVLNSIGMDLILGKSWLTKYDAVIQCSKRTVQLVAPSREKMEYQATSASEQCQLNQAKGAVLEDIQTVNK